MNRVSTSAEQTIELGRELAARLKPPVLVLLSGELGAGKTTLAKGIVSGLGAAREEEVTSPTFTLVHVFRNAATGVKVFHIDLYRIGDTHDFDTLGLEDVFAEPAVVLVEWPDRLRLRSDWPVVRVRFEHASDEERRIEVVGAT
ncbi:MAG: tRNA (adenosine(37)-N6)-threonylcarbamoyltransferase complex ATPase subunit type 1 TsaE [Candidatus Acidiferrales bacterium]